MSSVDDISELLRSVGSVLDLTESELVAVASQVSLATVDAGDTVVRQGDEAHSLYILIDGSLAVVVESRDGREQEVAELAPGAIIGELALLSGGRRAATVRALEESRLAMLSADEFVSLVQAEPNIGKLLASVASQHVRSSQLIVHLVDLLKLDEPSMAVELAHSVEWRSLETGDVLFEQGDETNEAYLVVMGRLRVTRHDPGHGRRFIREVPTGEIVGATSILLDAERSDSVHAVRDTELAVITRAKCSEPISPTATLTWALPA